MNVISSLASLPLKPPCSSATRKHDRTKIVRVAKASAARNSSSQYASLSAAGPCTLGLLESVTGRTDQKGPEPPHTTTTLPQPRTSIRPILYHSYCKIRTQAHEDEQRDDLKRETRNHDVNPSLFLRRVS